MLLSPEYHIVEELEQSLAFNKKNVPKELLAKPQMNLLLLHALTDWALIALFWSVGLYMPGWFYPVTVLLIASRYHSGGVILHDLTHMPLASRHYPQRR